MKNNFLKGISFSIVISLLFFYSCKDDDIADNPKDFPPVDKGDIQANRYLLTFFEKNDTSARQTVEFYDPDGIGGNDPIIREQLVLKKPSSSFLFYSSEIRFFNDMVEVTDQIINKQTKYISCYRSYNTANLRGGDFNKDVDGKQLGTTAEWSTLDMLGNDGSGVIRVTLNYIPLTKEGLCDAGVRILEGSVPYQIN